MIKTVSARALPLLAAAALLYPAIRKLTDGAWRDELSMTYEFGGQGFDTWFFVLVGLLEALLAGMILWPKTRVLGGLAMAGFFVGALVFNLGLRVDQALLPADRPGLSTLVPLDVSHLLIGLGVAWLWRTEGNPNHVLVAPRPSSPNR